MELFDWRCNVKDYLDYEGLKYNLIKLSAVQLIAWHLLCVYATNVMFVWIIKV